MNASAHWIQSPFTRAAILLQGDTEFHRPPVHICFLIDVSASMAGARLESVKQSLIFILQQFSSQDLISLITFDTNAEIVIFRCPTTTEKKESILRAIQQLRESGNTNMSAALLESRQCVGAPRASDESPPYKEGILFLTDGHANVGMSTTDGLCTIAETLLHEFQGVTLTTVAYGETHNSELLTRLAQSGGGSYNIVYTLESIASVFGEIMGGLSSVSAQNVKVYLPPGTTPLTHYKTTRLENGRTEILIGDLYAEGECILLLDTQNDPVDTIRITYDSMKTYHRKELQLTLQDLDPSSTLLKKFDIASFRYEVATLMRHMTMNPNHEEARRLQQKANDLLTTLKSLSYSEESILQLLIDDIETMLLTLEREISTVEHRLDQTIYLSPLETTQMAQHSAYIGLGRGLRSMVPQDPTVLPDDEQQDPISPLPTLLTRRRTARVDYQQSPFSNRHQRTSMNAMRSLSQTVGAAHHT